MSAIAAPGIGAHTVHASRKEDAVASSKFKSSAALAARLTSTSAALAARLASTSVGGYFERAWLILSGGLSLACAIHCALVPLLFVLLPTLKMALYSVRDPQHHTAIFLLQSVRFEQPLVFAGLILTAFTLIQARLRGKISGTAQMHVWLLYVFGAALTLTGAFSPARAVIQHAALMIAGGLFLVSASILNARRLKAAGGG